MATATALAVCGLASGAAAVTCTVSTTSVAFGVYDPTSPSANDANGAIDVACTCSGPDCVDFGYQLEIDTGASGSTSDRRLLPAGGGPHSIGYALYTDPTRLNPWGTGASAKSENYDAARFGSFQRTPVYGRIPAGQYVPADTYSEAPTVTIIY